MNNYAENKKTLDNIRREYACKGDVLFRTAIQYVVDCGLQSFEDEKWVKERLDIIDKRHNALEKLNKTPWVTREFEKAIVECAQEIAKVDTYNLLIYIQREVWLSNEGMDYQRAIELLRKCMEQIEEDENYDNLKTLEVFQYLGFTDDEIEEFGFDYLLEEEE